MSVIFCKSSGQIESNQGHTSQYAFLNIVDEETFIGVWGTSWKQPTILILNNFDFELLAFDNQELYEEWESNHDPRTEDEKIIKLTGKL